MIKGKPEELAKKLFQLDKDKVYEIIEEKQKRTLNQNSYYYKLLNELAKKMNIPSEELHFELIKMSSPFEEYLVPDEANLRGIQYYEIKGKRKKDDKIFKIVRVYVASHLLDTKEMGILLDNLIEECKLQNISVLTPIQLEELRNQEGYLDK